LDKKGDCGEFLGGMTLKRRRKNELGKEALQAYIIKTQISSDQVAHFNN
jgi:hypothetical protein